MSTESGNSQESSESTEGPIEQQKRFEQENVICPKCCSAIPKWKLGWPVAPTQWAYDQACAALRHHRERADAAENKLAEWNLLVAKSDEIGRLQARIKELESGASIVDKFVNEQYTKIQDFVIGKGLYHKVENKSHADIVLELAKKALEGKL